MLENGLENGRCTTSGLNPNYIKPAEAISILQQLPGDWKDVSHIYFYGSGLGSTTGNRIMQDWLTGYFPAAVVHLENDLVAAARSLCAKEPGIIAILGTGSNACRWDGRSIDDDQHSLGYILGDEGSGFSIGKRFVADYFYGNMPNDIAVAFSAFFPYSREEVLSATYHAPAPNRFIAGAAMFAGGRATNPYIKEIINAAFQAFIKAYLLRFKSLQLPVYFTGSIAAAFSDNLVHQLLEYGLIPGNILADPLEGLIKYHKYN
jgi:glucosamine kinase